MSRHVSVVMHDDLFAKMEAARGRESKSSFINHVLKMYFEKEGGEKDDTTLGTVNGICNRKNKLLRQ